VVTLLNCGHPSGWMIRLYDKGVRKAYCWGCLIDKVNLKPISEKQTTIAEDLGLAKTSEAKVEKVVETKAKK
jgi:hypothetical protein